MWFRIYKQAVCSVASARPGVTHRSVCSALQEEISKCRCAVCNFGSRVCGAAGQTRVRHQHQPLCHRQRREEGPVYTGMSKMRRCLKTDTASTWNKKRVLCQLTQGTVLQQFNRNSTEEYCYKDNETPQVHCFRVYRHSEITERQEDMLYDTHVPKNRRHFFYRKTVFYSLLGLL